MKPEDVLRLIREGSMDAIEGLGYLENLGTNLTSAGQAIAASSKDLKKLIEVAERLSKKIDPRKT